MLHLLQPPLQQLSPPALLWLQTLNLPRPPLLLSLQTAPALLQPLRWHSGQRGLLQPRQELQGPRRVWPGQI